MEPIIWKGRTTAANPDTRIHVEKDLPARIEVRSPARRYRAGATVKIETDDKLVTRA